jgi:hypothetical protein
MPTKHRTIRLSNELWQAAAKELEEVIPDSRRPERANPQSDWRITEALRMIATKEGILTMQKARKK